MNTACVNTDIDYDERGKVQVCLTYPEVYSRLNFETAIIVFMKKNGEARLMLGTRSIPTIRTIYGLQGNELGYQESRCNINNGNVAVYDLMIGEARCFNINRLVEVIWLGVLADREGVEGAGARFLQFESEYMKNNTVKASINSLDEIDNI